MLNPTNAAQANNSNTHTHQPIGFVRILAGTFSLYRKHLFLFFGFIALNFCGSLVAYLLGRFLPDFPVKNIVRDLIRMPFGLVSMGGIVIATVTIYLSGRITSRDALKQVGHRFWHVLVCALVWGLAFEISRTIISFTLFFLMDPITTWTPDSPVAEPLIRYTFVIPLIRLVSVPFSIYLQTPWGHITSDLLFFPLRSESLWIQLSPLAFVPFSIYFAVRWTFATTDTLIERPSIRNAFKRSSELTRGGWWRVWGMLICFSVLSLAIQHIAQITVGCLLVFTKLTDVTNLMDVVRWVVMVEFVNADRLFYEVVGWANLVVRALIFPIWVIGITLLYVDLRIRKDEFKVEMSVNNTSN